MLEVKAISVYYGMFRAISDVSLTVSKGEIVSVVGSNGAGKTTTLKTISGVLRPKSGEMSYEGKHIHDLDPAEIVEMGVAHVPEGRRIFPYMTVEENLAVGAYTKRSRAAKKDTLESVYGLFPRLKERRTQMAYTLSGGEQQMLVIGRALMSKPSLLMLDEPSLGLAPNLVDMVFEKIEQAHNEGVSILLVEQHVREALELADRAYVLETGHVVMEGPSKELLEDNQIKKAYLGI
jgi:branched-chain amino acid transport system ATP-binding protein